MYKHLVHREDSGRCDFDHEQTTENSDGIVHKLIIEKIQSKLWQPMIIIIIA